MRKKRFFCPKCGSNDTGSYSNDFLSASGILKDKRKCDDCGYIGILFTNIDDDKPYELDDGKEGITENDIDYVVIFGLLFLILLIILLI